MFIVCVAVENDDLLPHKVMSSSATDSLFMHVMFIFILFHQKKTLPRVEQQTKGYHLGKLSHCYTYKFIYLLWNNFYTF